MKTIAIIDDDVPIGDMLEELLTKEGFVVIRAYSGTEALYLLERQSPDLVLLDLMLPGLSGEELLPHIIGIPVIVISAKIDIRDKVSVLFSGASDYMTPGSCWRGLRYSCGKGQILPPCSRRQMSPSTRSPTPLQRLKSLSSSPAQNMRSSSCCCKTPGRLWQNRSSWTASVSTPPTAPKAH